MRKKTFACIACMITLSGCNYCVSDDSEQQEIRFQGNIQQLKPVVVDVSRASLMEGEVQLYLVERESGAPGVPADEDLHKMTSDASGVLSFTDGQKHFYTDKQIDVYGYVCQGMTGTLTNPLELPMTIQGDQMTDVAVMKSDFLYVKATEGYAKGSGTISLMFEHQFSKLQFQITTETPKTVDLSTFTVNILNVIMDGKFDLHAGILTLGTTLDGVSVQPKAASSAIILPQTVPAATTLFRFVVQGEEFVYVAPPGGEIFEKGKLYQYNIRLNKYPGVADQEIKVISSVKDWNNSEPVRDIVIGKGEQAMVTLTGVASGITISRGDVYLKSGTMSTILKDILVTNNKMNFLFPRLEKGGTVNIERAHFYTSHGDEFDYYFSGKVLNGNNMDQLALTLPQIGDAWGEGTIFVVGTVTAFDATTGVFKTTTTGINAYRGRVVRNTSLENKRWGVNESLGRSVLVGASSRDDGMMNLTALKKFAASKNDALEHYPAFKACSDLGEGWYFPAIDEMKAIVKQRDILNVNIEKQKGNAISLKQYGSSTEKDKTSCIATYCKDETDDYSSAKLEESEIRAVRHY